MARLERRMKPQDKKNRVFDHTWGCPTLHNYTKRTTFNLGEVRKYSQSFTLMCIIIHLSLLTTLNSTAKLLLHGARL